MKKETWRKGNPERLWVTELKWAAKRVPEGAWKGGDPVQHANKDPSQGQLRAFLSILLSS